MCIRDRLLDSQAWSLHSAEDAGLLFKKAPGGAGNAPARPMLEAAAREALGRARNGPSARRADFCLAAGGLLMLAGNETGVEEAYRQGLKHRPNHPALNHNLGNILLARGDFSAALDHFTTAFGMNPRLAGSALNAGVCLLRIGDAAGAADMFGRAVRINPRKPEAWVNLAVARREAQDRAGAVEALERALELQPRNSRLRQLLTEWKRGAG